SALLLAAACGNAERDQATLTQPGQLKIVVAFYPFQFIAERVAGRHADVASLTQPGAEPHDLELTPKQVAGLQEADLIIYEKGFQPAVDEAVQQTANQTVLETTTAVPLQELSAEHTHEEEGDEQGHQEEGHDDHRGLDPHVWLDPNNVATISTALAEQLSTIDQVHAADYAKNAEALKTELTSLDGDFKAGLANCKRTEFITSHDAFGYLAKRYILTQIGISGLSPDSEPSPARIAEVQREAKEHGITTIFYETLVSPAVAKAIASDLGLKTDVLDPVEGITAESRGQNYLSVMRSNLAALKAANACG
ncbi:MAG: zinc ABC transporter substrate-binding protein, partial [Propionibacteriaceae bacterium]|nr:zinc ABC transporter substrate-binding protein [Propionibacteriaceae bacterium]